MVGTQHPICTLGYVASESSASDTRRHSTRSGTAPASEPFLQKLVEKGELRGELLADPQPCWGYDITATLEGSDQFNQFLAVSWHTNFGPNHQDLKRSVRQHNKAHNQGGTAEGWQARRSHRPSTQACIAGTSGGGSFCASGLYIGELITLMHSQCALAHLHYIENTEHSCIYSFSPNAIHLAIDCRVGVCLTGKL